MNLKDLVEKNKKSDISATNLFGNQTPPVISNDMDISFLKSMTATSNKISSEKIIESGKDFPDNPKPGQLFRKENKIYIYLEDQE
ncbi:MAG: hypothetical protein RBS16_01870 [Candidatus Cloacimonadales bacterium]|jgi:hypothetical protein|nr:hypothetical protein [Candidatus Cloacimonadota bacterium]MDX9976760.1 hypothetical protein [Candidatus Cloacimonadales bacterium]